MIFIATLLVVLICLSKVHADVGPKTIELVQTKSPHILQCSDHHLLFQTSKEFHINGTQFLGAKKVHLNFLPSLDGIYDDISPYPLTSNQVILRLRDGHQWRDAPGPLFVVSVDIGRGFLDVNGGNGTKVAEVVEDTDPNRLSIFPGDVRVYQSALQEKIVITGTGFTDDMFLVLEPPMQIGVDYTLQVISQNTAALYLKGSKKWRAEPGFIIARSVKSGGKSYALAGSEGIRIAIVLADPVIIPSKETLHETQSKLLVISGTGFTNVADVKITLRPTTNGAYKVISVLEDAIRVQLKPDNDWLPSFSSLKDEDESKKVTLSVASIDTGAGEIQFDTPINIGIIIKDREDVVCDDSCEFAFDGVCDVDNDLYTGNPDKLVHACAEGTDCTDCGGPDVIIDYFNFFDPASELALCTNTCMYPRDGICDDPRGTKYCELGTDCQDCGPIGADNFTRSDDDGWWDDDDGHNHYEDGIPVPT